MTKADPEMGRLFLPQADNVPPDMTAIEFALTPQAFPYFLAGNSNQGRAGVASPLPSYVSLKGVGQGGN